MHILAKLNNRGISRSIEVVHRPITMLIKFALVCTWTSVFKSVITSSLLDPSTVAWYYIAVYLHLFIFLSSFKLVNCPIGKISIFARLACRLSSCLIVQLVRYQFSLDWLVVFQVG